MGPTSRDPRGIPLQRTLSKEHLQQPLQGTTFGGPGRNPSRRHSVGKTYWDLRGTYPNECTPRKPPEYPNPGNTQGNPSSGPTLEPPKKTSSGPLHNIPYSRPTDNLFQLTLSSLPPALHPFHANLSRGNPWGFRMSTPGDLDGTPSRHLL
jgi:hypothetical protein